MGACFGFLAASTSRGLGDLKCLRHEEAAQAPNYSISTSSGKLLRWPVIPRSVAESMRRLDSATTLRFAQNDDRHYRC